MGDHGWPGFWDHYRSGGWEPDTKTLLGELLRPGDLFVDVGAWIGPVTLWALELGASVVAVEPDPVACAELRRQVPSSVEVWEVAVATEPGTMRLAPNPKHGGEYGDSMSRLGAVGLGVPARTLPGILAGRRPALVKMDVEGYEIALLPSLAPWLAAQGVALQVSCHGTLPDPAWFSGFGDVAWPQSTWGDVVARP